jgi:hydrogenase small subunit
VGTGHPCIGCTEKGIGFEKPIHALAELLTVTPPTQFARPAEPQGVGATFATVAGVAAIAGVAVGIGAKIAQNLGKREDEP